MNTNTAQARTYPIESLLDVANGVSDISISHARKLIAENLITKSYEKVGEGPGRPTRHFELTDNGRRYLRINSLRTSKNRQPEIEPPAVSGVISNDESEKPVKTRKAKVQEIPELPMDGLKNVVKTVMHEIIEEERAASRIAQTPQIQRRRRGRPTNAERARRLAVEKEINKAMS